MDKVDREVGKSLTKVENTKLRINFLTSCIKADIIPRFRKFRISNNGSFDSKSVFEFQKNLPLKELFRAKQDTKTCNNTIATKRQLIKAPVPECLLPSIAFHTLDYRRKGWRHVKNRQDKKLLALAEE